MGLPWRIEFYIIMNQYSEQPTISLIYNCWCRMFLGTRSCHFTTVFFLTFHTSFDATCAKMFCPLCPHPVLQRHCLSPTGISSSVARLAWVSRLVLWHYRSRWCSEVLPSCGRGPTRLFLVFLGNETAPSRDRPHLQQRRFCCLYAVGARGETFLRVWCGLIASPFRGK